MSDVRRPDPGPDPHDARGPTRPDDTDELDPLHGLMDPDEGENTPANDADAPAPPG